jgi:hypothetical protein
VSLCSKSPAHSSSRAHFKLRPSRCSNFKRLVMRFKQCPSVRLLANCALIKTAIWPAKSPPSTAVQTSVSAGGVSFKNAHGASIPPLCSALLGRRTGRVERERESLLWLHFIVNREQVKLEISLPTFCGAAVCSQNALAVCVCPKRQRGATATVSDPTKIPLVFGHCTKESTIDKE